MLIPLKMCYTTLKETVPNSIQFLRKVLHNLAQEIRRAADTYKVPHRILIAILAQESSYRLLVIGKTCNKKGKCRRDFGIGQIAEKTAKFYGFDTKRLTSDLSYSVHASAEVLSWFRKTYSKREPEKWWVRYNCGTKRSVERNTCKTYHKAVQRWF